MRGVPLVAVAAALVLGTGLVVVAAHDGPRRTDVVDTLSEGPREGEQGAPPTEAAPTTTAAAGDTVPTASAETTAPPTAAPSPEAAPSTTPGPTGAAPAPEPTARPSTPDGLIGAPARLPDDPAPEPAGGVVLETAWDAPTAAVGDKATGTVTVRNTRRTPIVTRFYCPAYESPVEVGVQLPHGAPGTRPTDPVLAAFQDQVLSAPAEDAAVLVRGDLCSAPGSSLDGSQPTAFGSYASLIGPGEAITQSFTWTATDGGVAAAHGPVDAVGRLVYATAQDPQAVLQATSAPARATLEAGPTQELLTPAQALDRALASPGFARAVRASDPADWPVAGDGPWTQSSHYGPWGATNGPAVYQISLREPRTDGTYPRQWVVVDATTGAIKDERVTPVATASPGATP